MPGILMSYWGEKYSEEKQKTKNDTKKSETSKEQAISKDK